MATVTSQKILSVGIHQPNFMPWLGYFLKMAVSDIFIYHDNVEHSKGSLTRRTYIREHPYSTHPKYLTLSLKQHSDHVLIKDLELRDVDYWYDDIRNKIYNSYVKAPYFTSIFDRVVESMRTCYDPSFSNFSINLLEYYRSLLEIDVITMRSSDIPIDEKGHHYNLALVKHCGGLVYNSGMGAKKYQCEEDYDASGIQLKYIDSGQFLSNYAADFPNWNYKLSLLDALFYLGIDNVIAVISNYKEIYHNEI